MNTLCTPLFFCTLRSRVRTTFFLLLGSVLLVSTGARAQL